MAITVNGQILRNLPEQVSKNTEDIIDLQDVSENYGIRITALEGNAIALATFQDCTFTGTSSFQGPISSASGFTFNGNGSVGGNLLVSGASTFTGTVTASGNENVGGNLAVTGNITGGSIIENMSGYSFTAQESDANVAINPIYAGVVKNGNKVTFVIFATITKAEGAIEAERTIGTFTIPSAVGAKLYPTSIGGNSVLETEKIEINDQVYSGVSGYNYIRKSSNTSISFSIDGGIIHNMVAGTPYHYRKEVTFLLSENLAS